MSHSYSSLIAHIVFSTKERRPFIDPALERRLFPYIGGIARDLGGKLYVVNGSTDHVHLLAELPTTLAFADAVGKLKGNSSKWIHDTFPDRWRFAWQRGYSAFSVSKSQVASVARYIERQKEHHKKVSFKDEFIQILQKHGITYDERFVFL